MKRVEAILLLAIVPLALAGCATVPEKSEMQRLNGEEVRALSEGNTYTRAAHFGHWAAYYETEDTGAAKAWGSWGSETVSMKYTISSDGEICEIYSGDPDWANSQDQYCGVRYKDAEGNYYTEVTQDPEPGDIGNMYKFEIKPGDEYGLSE